MSNKPSPGALDFAKRHGIPEPRTRQEAVKMMQRILEPHRGALSGASWRDSWRRHCGRRVELWTEADEARMDIIGSNGNDGLAYGPTDDNNEEK